MLKRPRVSTGITSWIRVITTAAVIMNIADKLVTEFRSSCPAVFFEEGVPRNFGKFTGKHPCQSLFFNKKEALAQVFSCEFFKISKNTFLTEHLPAAALNYIYKPIFTMLRFHFVQQGIIINYLQWFCYRHIYIIGLGSHQNKYWTIKSPLKCI